jgi:thiamine-phosphate pyrophosphorylase
LIAITDSLRDGVEGLAMRAFAAVRGGATMVHLRLADESALTLFEAARAIRSVMPLVPLIVNARFDVALAAGADGVHLGVDDLSAAAVRGATPPEFLIGVSVATAEEAERVAAADYVGIGPVFGAGGTEGGTTPLGPDGFTALAERCGKPAVAIGGIDASNAAAVMAAGAAGIAVISALFGSRDPAVAARALRDAQASSGR